MNDDNYEDFDYQEEEYAELDFNEAHYGYDDNELSDPDSMDLELDEFALDEPPELILDVPYVPSEQEVVQLMLDMAEVNSKDYLIDLGCGDGRILVTAAKQRGTKGIGVDIDPARIADAMELAAGERVEHLVDFIESDFRDIDIRKATVVTLYLLEHMNLEIKSKLLRELKPGTKVVSNTFAMGDWQPVKQTRHQHSNIYMWLVP